MMWHASSWTLSLQLVVIPQKLTHHQICLQVVTEGATSLTLLLRLMNFPDTPQSTSQHNVDLQVKVFPLVASGIRRGPYKMKIELLFNWICY